MKRYIMALSFLIVSIGQTIAQTITIEPKDFTAVDEITIRVDVTGNEKLEALTGDAYLWMWVPGGPDAPTNVNPGSTLPDPAIAKFTKVSDKVYEKKLVLSTYFGKSPREITSIGIILKGNDWSDGQTADAIFEVAPLEFVPRVNRVFPNVLTNKDVITVIYDQKLATSPELQRIKNITASVELFDSTNTSLGMIENKPTREDASKVYSYTFVAKQVAAGAEANAQKLRYRFAGTVLDESGVEKMVTTQWFEKEFSK